MIDDPRLADELRAFYREEPVVRPDPARVTRAVLDEIHARPQDGRSGWRLPALRRGEATAPSATATDTHAYQPHPIQATNGQRATVIGRTQSMLSPAKAIAAGAIVFAIGGVMLIAQPFQPQGSVPGAESEPIAPTAAWVTGTVSGGTGGRVSSGAADVERVTRSRFLWEDMQIAMSDRRLSGTLSAINDVDVHTGAAGDVSTFSVGAGTYRIENEAGSWEGPNLFLQEGRSPSGTSDFGLLVGSGAYEGLSAFLVFDFSQTEAPVVGAIFPGELPPVATFE